MKLKTTKTAPGVLFLLTALLLSACGPSNVEPTPTPFSVEAVYTAAAETLSVQLTQAAQAMPSATPTMTATATNTAEPTATLSSLGILPTSTTGFIVINTPVVLSTITPGPSPTPSATATSRTVGCYNSDFVSHVTIPDGTVMQPGETFTKIWEIKNIGTGACSWTRDFRLVFVGGNILGSDSTRIGQPAGIGGVIRVRLDMKAPTAPGTYVSQWRVATEDWQAFGVVLSVSIRVPGATFTPTPAVTNTPTNTLAPPTNTATSTNTPETPTNTPEPTP